MSVSISPHPPQNLLSDFFIIAILVGMKCSPHCGFNLAPQVVTPLNLQAVLTGVESRVTQGVHGDEMRLT